MIPPARLFWRIVLPAMLWPSIGPATPLAGDVAGEQPAPPADSEPARADSEEELEALFDAIDGMAPGEAIEAIEEYLEAHPDSTQRQALRARIDALRQAPQKKRDPSLRAAEDPLSFPASVPRGRVSGGLELGPPAWFQAMGSYEHGFSERFSAGGSIGISERVGVAEGLARLTLLSSERRHQLLSGALALRFEVGDDSRVQVEPRLGYLRRAGPLDLQASIGPRIRATGLSQGASVRYRAGVGIGWEVTDRWWAGLETAGYVQRVDAVRTDLSESTSSLVSFFAITAGGRYRLGSTLAMTACLSIPVWYRFRNEYTAAVSVGIEYRPPRP